MAETDRMPEESGHVYCLFCETGEEGAVEQLCRRILGAEALTLRTERYRIWRGARKLMTERLLPGYVFVYAAAAIEPYRFRMIEHVLRVLVWSSEPELHAEDLRFARWVRACGGNVGVSQAYREGDHVVIVQGPLKQYEGEILWVDKRKGKAKVRVRTESMDLVMWMFFDYLQLDEERAVRQLDGWQKAERDSLDEGDGVAEAGDTDGESGDAGDGGTGSEPSADIANAGRIDTPRGCEPMTNDGNTEETGKQ